MKSFKGKALAVLLSATLLISGCHKAIEKETEEDTGSVTASESRESESEETDTTSDDSKNRKRGELQAPPDALIKEFAKVLAAQNQGIGQECYAGLSVDGSYKKSNATLSLMEVYSLWVEYEFSEEAYEEYKKEHPAKASMTLDEYRQEKLLEDSDFSALLDDDFRLKTRPSTRALIGFEARNINLDDTDVYEQCVREGFNLLLSDPDLRKSLELAIQSDHADGGAAMTAGIYLSLDGKKGIRLTAQVYTLGGETLSAETTVDCDIELSNELEGPSDVSVINAFRRMYACRAIDLEISEEETPALFERLEKLRENSDIDSSLINNDTLRSNELVKLYFNDTFESEYSYCGEGIWCYESYYLSLREYFRPKDKETAERLLDELITLTSLPEISAYYQKNQENQKNTKLTADFGVTYDKSVLASDYPSGNCQIVSYYVNDRCEWTYILIKDGDALFYFEGDNKETDATVGGQTVIEHEYEYEYAGREGEMYYRPNTEDVFFPAEQFEGNGSLDFVLKETAQPYTFLYAFRVTDGTDDYHCEIYERDLERMAILVDSEGNPCAGWRFNGEIKEQADHVTFDNGVSVIQGIVTIETDPGIDEYLEHARAHKGVPNATPTPKTDPNMSAADWIEYDQEELGLPNYMGAFQKGKDIDGSPVVSAYLDRFKNGEPFSMDWWQLGQGRYEWNTLTVRGMDFYHSKVVSSHNPNTSGYDMLYLALGDYIYQGAIEDARRYPKDDSFTEREVQLQLPYALQPNREFEFIQAYEGTLNGEEYVIEEWTADHDKVIFFCQNGEVKGFRLIDNGVNTVCHILGFETKARDSLLVEPES